MWGADDRRGGHAKKRKLLAASTNWQFRDFLADRGEADAAATSDAGECPSDDDKSEPDPLADLGTHLAIEERMLEETTATTRVSVPHAAPNPQHANYRNSIPAGIPTHEIKRAYLLPQLADVGSERFLAEAEELFRHPTVCVKSPMGTGKSKAEFGYIGVMLRQYSELRVLFVTARVSLTASFLEALQPLGFVAYNQKGATRKGFLAQQNRIIIQLDSLPKLLAANDPQQLSLRFDIVLLDEAESTLNHFSAETMKKRKEVWDRFKLICTTCTQLICFDADLGRRVVEITQQLRQGRQECLVSASANVPASSQVAVPAVAAATRRSASVGSAAPDRAAEPQPALTFALDARTRFAAYIREGVTVSSASGEAPEKHPSPLRIIINTKQTDHRHYVELKSEDRFFIRLRMLLDGRQRIVIPINQKKTADKIEKFIQAEYPHLDGKVLYYHGESSQAMKEGAGQCNAEWVKYDVVIYTPTIVYGVDFNPEGPPHFDAVLAYAVPTSNVVREFTQMLGRVRRLTTDMVYIYIAQPPGSLREYTAEDIESEIDAQWAIYNKAGACDPMMREQYFDRGQVRYRYHDKLYRKLFVMNELEKKTSDKYFPQMFWAAAFERGGRIREEDGEMMPSAIGRMIADGELLDQLSRQMFLQSCAAVATVTNAPNEKARAEAEAEASASDSDAMVYDPFAQGIVNVDEILRNNRIAQQRLQEGDHHHIGFARLLRLYNLKEISVDDRSKRKRTAMAELVRCHGQPANINQFHAFCLVNNSISLCLRRWVHAVEDATAMPFLLKERTTLDHIRVVKGLLALVGFTRAVDDDGTGREEEETAEEKCGQPEERSPLTNGCNDREEENTGQTNREGARPRVEINSQAEQLHDDPSRPSSQAASLHLTLDPEMLAALVGPSILPSVLSRHAPPQNSVLRILDYADVCTNRTVNTISVKARVGELNTVEWLQSEENTFRQLGISFTVKAEYKVKDVMALLDRTLRRVLGFGIARQPTIARPREQRADTARSQRGSKASPRKRLSIRTWRLETDRRDSMLELAYALSHSRNAETSKQLGAWDAAASVRVVQPQFRWQLLTGVDAPESPVLARALSECEDSSRSVLSRRSVSSDTYALSTEQQANQPGGMVGRTAGGSSDDQLAAAAAAAAAAASSSSAAQPASRSSSTGSDGSIASAASAADMEWMQDANELELQSTQRKRRMERARAVQAARGQLDCDLPSRKKARKKAAAVEEDAAPSAAAAAAAGFDAEVAAAEPSAWAEKMAAFDEQLKAYRELQQKVSSDRRMHSRPEHGRGSKEAAAGRAPSLFDAPQAAVRAAAAAAAAAASPASAASPPADSAAAASLPQPMELC